MQVILAGYNGDIEVLHSGQGHFSPETLSAAYARISRYADPVPELRRQAREEVVRARKSNRAIVFGLGHHSVAEHAVFNFDILGCSRLAIEALEWHRLCSYTEKSQRYITLAGDYVIPAELDDRERPRFVELIEAQNDTYRELLPLLQQRQEQQHPEMCERKRDRRVLEGWAKEDARYAVALATAGQLGFTCNARNLELIVRRVRHAPLEEIRRLGGHLFGEARQVAPSLIILADEEAYEKTYGGSVRSEFFREADRDLARAAGRVAIPEDPAAADTLGLAGDVALVNHTPDPDAAVLAAVLFEAHRGSLTTCRLAARQLDDSARRELVRGVLAHLSEYDTLPRAFEQAVFQFEIVLDASAMAQLKRHRMSTQHWGRYDPTLGFTTPPEVEAVGQAQPFAALMERTAETHRWLVDSLETRGAPTAAADYVLTNAHRRRVSLTMNLREAHHFSRLREDEHAQWAIRRLAHDISALIRQVAPATAMLLGGKDRYAEIFRQAMGTENA